MKTELELVPEPTLEFSNSQTSDFPKDGLFLYGPPSDPGQPTTIRFGLVGTTYGRQVFRDWHTKITGYIESADSTKAHHLFWPGFSEVFNADWPTTPVAEYSLSGSALSNTIRMDDRYHAIYDTVSALIHPILTHLQEEDRHPDVWFIVMPDEIYRYGRPKSYVPMSERVDSGSTLGRSAALDHLAFGDLFNDLSEESRKYQFDLDIHAQIKARLLGRAVVQIVRESTLTGGEYLEGNEVRVRRLQDPASTAWNIGTTTYFKSQGSPWRLATVREGVCYVGLVYKKDETTPSTKNVCCAAQMFLNSGDGLVFRGANGPWSAAAENEFHLSREAAKSLVGMVVDGYQVKHGHPPSELFIHSQTNFDDTEWNGFQEAVDKRTSIVGIKIRKTNRLKIYRAGKMPLVRGTAWVQSDRDAYLWTSGYIPRIATYPGWEVPNPLTIEVQRGKAEVRTVLSDVMGLTKLNYNACIYGDSRPVTLRFASAVGDVLTAGPDLENRPLPFKYYI